MSWNDERNYEKKNNNVVDFCEKRQKLRWSHEVMMDKNREPRAALESPLKIWWLAQQESK